MTTTGMDECTVLDPRLWQNFPQELLERVIAKLPFSRVVAFRTVCKLWYSDIIPRVASQVQASTKSALLYVGCHAEKSKGSAWWLQVCNLENSPGALEEFQPRSFPSPRCGDDVLLMASEKGLLFFAFTSRKNNMVQDIVACNPLTSRSKCLGLPRPLHTGTLTSPDLLVGAVFDANTENYNLVAAGLDDSEQYSTFLYNSSTCTWTDAPSMLPTLLEVGQGGRHLRFESTRSMCCNDNLYWYTMGFPWLRDILFVLMFDIENCRWKMIPLDLEFDCPDGLGFWQIATFQGEILVWHLHEWSLDDDSDDDEGFGESLHELFNPDYVRYPQHIVWLCRYDLEVSVDPPIKMMDHYMIERIDAFLHVYSEFGEVCQDYFAFSKGNLFYHALQLSADSEEKIMRVVVHDTSKNSFTELPLVKEWWLPGGHDLCASNVWSLTPSLTSLP